jgi:AbiV family abortive infection protein
MPKPYAGPLTHAQIDSGIDSCLTYAERLKRIVSTITGIERGLAFSLACIRVEELTKILLLMEMRSGHHDGESWSRFWKKFKEHRAKWREYGRWRFQQHGVTDEQTARELGEVFSAWAGAKNAGLFVEYDPTIGFIQPGLFPDFLESALRMGDEVVSEIRSMLSRREGG